MSSFTLAPATLDIVVKNDSLKLYQFGSKVAKHYFCRVCGIYPFHETKRNPGEYRVNLGCIEEVDINTLDITTFDGKSI